MIEAQVFDPLSDESDQFKEVKLWFDARGWAQVTQAMLPATGICVPGLAAVFLYATDSPIGWMEWAVTNPVADVRLRQEALDLCIQECIAQAKLKGMKLLCSSLSHDGLIDRYKAKGFSVTDTGMTNMVRII